MLEAQSYCVSGPSPAEDCMVLRKVIYVMNKSWQTAAHSSIHTDFEKCLCARNDGTHFSQNTCKNSDHLTMLYPHNVHESSGCYIWMPEVILHMAATYGITWPSGKQFLSDH